MFKRAWLTLQIGLLIFVLVFLAITLLNNASEEVAPIEVFYAFTPEPTAQADVPVNLPATDEIVERFTVSIEIPTREPIDLSAWVVPSITPPPMQPSREAKVVETKDEAVRPIILTDRATFARRFHNSRVDLSSLTYIINVAAGDGVLSCTQLSQYYEHVTLFYHLDVADPLQRANDYYVRSMNIIAIGVHPVYQLCIRQLAASPEEDMLAVNEIVPDQIWLQAVADSNAALELNTRGIEWLEGSTRLLGEIYTQFEAKLDSYEAALETPSVEACAMLQETYSQLVMEPVYLDLGEGTEFLSSYSKYELAIQTIVESGQSLYAYCDPTEGGAGQLIEGNVQSVPSNIISTAQIGLEDAKQLIERAHFYISADASQNE